MSSKITPRPPILGSFEDIGEQVKQEVTKLPGDILAQAMETVGMNVGGKQQKQHQQSNIPQDPTSAWNQIDTQKDEQTKKEIARHALEELTRPSQTKEPSVWEKQQQEEEQKKLMEEERKKQSQSVALPSSGVRKVPGIKSAVKSKQSSEIGKNVKQD
jgi:hypothetical protein